MQSKNKNKPKPGKVGGTPNKVCGASKKVGGSAFEIGRMYCVTTVENPEKVSGFCEYVRRDGIRLKTGDASSRFIKYNNISCKKLIVNASIKYIKGHFKNDLKDGFITYATDKGCCYENITLFSFVKEYNNNKNDKFKTKVDEAFPGYNKIGNGPKIEDCINKSFSNRIKNPCKKLMRGYESNILPLLYYIKNEYPNKFKKASNQIIFQKLMPLHDYLLNKANNKS